MPQHPRAALVCRQKLPQHSHWNQQSDIEVGGAKKDIVKGKEPVAASIIHDGRSRMSQCKSQLAFTNKDRRRETKM